jgi:glycyl-tRNA synthetase beta chain
MVHHELFIEIGVEEIPAGIIMPAVDNLQKLMIARLDGLGLEYGVVRTAATPRRLAICVSELAARQPDRQEEFLGPPRKAAFDGNNAPTKAAVGFAASKGARTDELEIIETPKGEYVRLVKEKKGEETAALLTTVLPEVIQGLIFPKSMRWGNERTVFVRPIQWLLALYGGSVVPFTIGAIASGNTTRGHRFMAPDSFAVSSYDEYLTLLRQNHVLADHAERRAAVVAEISRAVADASEPSAAEVLPDEELVDIVTNLVESPHGVCGVFDERFLALPDSVLITAMREHQKYFSVVDRHGSLLARFVAVNNTHIKDQKSAAAGHQRVLRARLEDALFFFNEDQGRPLADRVADLTGLIFQNRLGTMYDKTQRMVRLAVKLARELAPEYRAASERAALLAKADLLTAMVGEFPSLQGVMGRDYAHLDGEEEAVAVAIQEHYLPVRAGDQLPAGIPGTLVGMADRLDTIVGCFGIGQQPSGTADPFGLRRLALGLLHIIEHRAYSLSLAAFVEEALLLYGDKISEDPAAAKSQILEFIKGRFANDMISQGVPREAVEAVTSVSFDDVVDCRARIEALIAIKDQPTFAILAAAFKRVMNIIKDSGGGTVAENLLQEPAEKKMYEVFQAIRQETGPLLAAKDYDKALGVMLRMKEPVDAFFDGVMVMVDDQALRQNRLNLLSAVAQLFLQVGDFSRMHGISQ